MTTKFLINVKREDLEKALAHTGLLYALNFLILHPTGLALALDYDDPSSPPRLELLCTGDEADPIIFAPEVFELGRAKLKSFLDRRNKLGMPVTNESLLNEAVNILCDEQKFSSHYEPSEQRNLMGTEVLPPLLIRDDTTPYITYVPYERKDMILATAGVDRKSPGRIVGLLDRAWLIDHPNYRTPPEVVSLPLWMSNIWWSLLDDQDPEKPKTFVGRKFTGNYTDRIFLTHGPS